MEGPRKHDDVEHPGRTGSSRKWSRKRGRRKRRRRCFGWFRSFGSAYWVAMVSLFVPLVVSQGQVGIEDMDLYFVIDESRLSDASCGVDDCGRHLEEFMRLTISEFEGRVTNGLASESDSFDTGLRVSVMSYHCGHLGSGVNYFTQGLRSERTVIDSAIRSVRELTQYNNGSCPSQAIGATVVLINHSPNNRAYSCVLLVQDGTTRASDEVLTRSSLNLARFYGAEVMPIRIVNSTRSSSAENDEDWLELQAYSLLPNQASSVVDRLVGRVPTKAPTRGHLPSTDSPSTTSDSQPSSQPGAPSTYTIMLSAIAVALLASAGLFLLIYTRVRRKDSAWAARLSRSLGGGGEDTQMAGTAVDARFADIDDKDGDHNDGDVETGNSDTRDVDGDMKESTLDNGKGNGPNSTPVDIKVALMTEFGAGDRGEHGVLVSETASKDAPKEDEKKGNSDEVLVKTPTLQEQPEVSPRENQKRDSATGQGGSIVPQQPSMDSNDREESYSSDSDSDANTSDTDSQSGAKVPDDVDNSSSESSVSDAASSSTESSDMDEPDIRIVTPMNPKPKIPLGRRGSNISNSNSSIYSFYTTNTSLATNSTVPASSIRTRSSISTSKSNSTTLSALSSSTGNTSSSAVSSSTNTTSSSPSSSSTGTSSSSALSSSTGTGSTTTTTTTTYSSPASSRSVHIDVGDRQRRESQRTDQEAAFQSQQDERCRHILSNNRPS